MSTPLLVSPPVTRRLGLAGLGLATLLPSQASAIHARAEDYVGRLEALDGAIAKERKLNDELKQRHVRRLRSGECSVELGFVLSDITEEISAAVILNSFSSNPSIITGFAPDILISSI